MWAAAPLRFAHTAPLCSHVCVALLFTHVHPRYLKADKAVTSKDIKSAWSGIRPLVLDPSKPDSKSVSRTHVIEVGKTNLVTIAGGKWTTYRQMAEDTVDKCLEVFPELKKKRNVTECATLNLGLIGSDRAGVVSRRKFDKVAITLREEYVSERSERTHQNGRRPSEASMSHLLALALFPSFHTHIHSSWHSSLPLTFSHARFARRYNMAKDIAAHLVSNYGTRALQIAEMTRPNGPGSVAHVAATPQGHRRLVAKFPFLEAEVVFAVRQEYAFSVVDVIARRTRLAFIDSHAAEQVSARVAELMGKELGWSRAKQAAEVKEAKRWLVNMNLKEGQ